MKRQRENGEGSNGGKSWVCGTVDVVMEGMTDCSMPFDLNPLRIICCVIFVFFIFFFLKYGP